MRESWKRLAIDTATKYVYLSLVVDDKEVDCVYEEGLNNHSVTVIPHLWTILKRHGLSLTDIDEVICGIGPGSYTGIRIAVTIAKMIGYLNKIKIRSVSSLALIASSAEKGLTLAMIDARRGNAFMGLFEVKNDTIMRIKADMLDNIEEYRSVLPDDTNVVAEGRPDIGRIIRSKLVEDVEDVLAMVPNYLQITEAERNKCQP